VSPTPEVQDSETHLSEQTQEGLARLLRFFEQQKKNSKKPQKKTHPKLAKAIQVFESVRDFEDPSIEGQLLDLRI